MVNLSKIKGEIEEIKEIVKSNTENKSLFVRIEEMSKKFEEISKSNRYFEYFKARESGDNVLADRLIEDLSSECQKLFRRNYYFDTLHKETSEIGRK